MFRLLYFCPLVSHLNLKAKQYMDMCRQFFPHLKNGTLNNVCKRGDNCRSAILSAALYIIYSPTINTWIFCLCVKNKLSTSVACVCVCVRWFASPVHINCCIYALADNESRQERSESRRARARLNRTRQNAIILYFYHTIDHMAIVCFASFQWATMHVICYTIYAYAWCSHHSSLCVHCAECSVDWSGSQIAQRGNFYKYNGEKERKRATKTRLIFNR